jgi:hypothetical protein
MASEAIGVTRYGSRIERGNEMIMRPAWRSRTTARRRAVAAGLTCALIGALGLVLLWLVVWVLDRLDAPGWLVSGPWWIPTLVSLVWALRRPKPGEVTEDGADSWLILSMRTVMVGVDEPRPRPLRAITAVVFGAPFAWGLVVVAILTLAGIA